MEEKISQFVAITGASSRDAKRLIEQYKHVEVAINAYYNESSSRTSSQSGASTSKLNGLFDQYKDPDGDSITVDGTIKLCQDLSVDPEDVVLLAVAYELKSPRVGEWNRLLYYGCGINLDRTLTTSSKYILIHSTLRGQKAQEFSASRPLRRSGVCYSRMAFKAAR
ncbi:hypothetical protein NEOLEDRAFT_761209 [Neolentinus lepideus HHB14362 ss-1]|uniref:DCUN1 domain-containing protein n=1 Tax=Neolentinus lepideus HHB14362 ss-1 TaxID=1314782 RepID=A0A165PNK2_9AGAM|nr:hypothetical protein NEOLEDRAFT_761209 [Neolentinus lepideus HHB14362 ss-1]